MQKIHIDNYYNKCGKYHSEKKMNEKLRLIETEQFILPGEVLEE